jgi:hypothetical protein
MAGSGDALTMTAIDNGGRVTQLQSVTPDPNPPNHGNRRAQLGCAE